MGKGRKPAEKMDFSERRRRGWEGDQGEFAAEREEKLVWERDEGRRERRSRRDKGECSVYCVC